MIEKFGFCDALLESRKNDWWESFVWIGFVLLGSLAPIYVSTLVLLIAKQPFGLVDFAGHGEFSIYSAALLATCCYLVLRDSKKPFPLRHVFGFLVFFVLLTATAIFASVTTFSKIGLKALAFDENVVTTLSLNLFVFSLLVTYISNVLDAVTSRADPRKASERQEKRLKEDFDSLENVR